MDEVNIPTEYKFLTEYAKSGRAACKGCKNPIQKDDLRMAIMVQNRFADKKVPAWFHFDCFYSRHKPKSTAEIGHFGEIRFEDQKRIRAMISDTGDDCNLEHFSVEYAKSGGSACRLCEQKIPKNDCRISKLDFESQQAMMYGPVKRWFHVECFVSTKDELGFTSSGDKIPGFDKLEEDDQKNLRTKLSSKKSSNKRKAEKDSKNGDNKEIDTKKKKTDSKMDKKLEKQSKVIFDFIEALKSLKTTDVIRILELNEFRVPHSNASKIEILADCMAFGVPNKCPECKDGSLRFRSVGYKCMGNLTQWVNCMYLCKEPESRHPLKIPDDLKNDYAFLDSYKFKKGSKRLIDPNDEKAAEIAAKSKSDTNGTKPSTSSSTQPSSSSATVKKEPEANLPLTGHNIAMSGKLKYNKNVVKSKIEQLGGKLVNEVNRTVLFVIANKKNVEKDSEKIKDAKRSDVAVVNETILDEDLINVGIGICPIIEKYLIVDWGKAIEQKYNNLRNKEKVKTFSKSGTSKSSSQPNIQKVKVVDGLAVDPDSEIDDISKVIVLHKVPYSVVLNLVDLIKNRNSYYKLQALEEISGTKKKSYWVFRSWGRIGTDIGGNKLEKYTNREDAINAFIRIYLEQTGNDWSNRDNFRKIPGRYYPIDISYTLPEDEANRQLMVIDSKSSLPISIQELIKMIFDVDKMKKQMTEYHIDLNKMPLGKISKNQILSAYKVLNEISDLLKNGKNEEKMRKQKALLLDACTRFYTLVPHDFGLDQIKLIDNDIDLVEKINMLDSLLDMEIAYNIINDVDKRDENDVFKKHYEKLNCNIEIVNQECNEFKIINDYVMNTHAATHSQYKLEIVDIFKVKRDEDLNRFKKDYNNRMLLWHGSRVTNYAGILSQGLRCAPPEAPVNGYMFGKGIYFADMVSKSANYCCTTRDDNVGLLLLNEVALSEQLELTQAKYIEKLPKGKHSVKGIGRTIPDPTMMIELDDGVKVPYGKPIINEQVKKSSLLYNEYIVYDVSQVKMRYLLKVKFLYNY